MGTEKKKENEIRNMIKLKRMIMKKNNSNDSHEKKGNRKKE